MIGRTFSTPAQAGGAERLEGSRQRYDLLLALDRTGPGDDGDPRAPDLQPPRLHDRPLTLELGRGPFVRGHDRKDFFDAVTRLEHFRKAWPLFPECGDHGLVRSVNHLGSQTQGSNMIRHVLDLNCGRIWFHDHDHGRPSSTWEKVPGGARIGN